ncbi:hypothetical protein MTR67_017620 [Solanum verrucosum]|uniref:Uncharacterized protein n=1 Tax=Solanum verrucosum TaxID=315347 RepID=A0AAF0TSD7_SOLVR|nr:hypothetical protein MTR67_017620 [Solanum verrucosum]
MIQRGVPLLDFEDSKYGATEEDPWTIDQSTVRTFDPSIEAESSLEEHLGVYEEVVWAAISYLTQVCLRGFGDVDIPWLMDRFLRCLKMKTWLSMVSTSHVKEGKKDLAKDVHRLARFGVWLMDFNK